MGVHRGDLVELYVDRLAYGGRGVARADGLVVFVAGGAPGDVVQARVGRVRRSYAEADVVGIITPSPDRVAPRCPHFGPCGGCAWQHLDYPAQARAKDAIVRESLVHLGGLEEPHVLPIVAAPQPWYYRNKMEFSFHPVGMLGLHQRGDWNRIVPIEVCFLQSPESVEIVRAVRAFAQSSGLVPYDPASHHGFLRSLVIREGRGTGDRLVGLITGPEPFPQATAFVQAVRAACPEVTGIVRGVVAGQGEAAPVTRVDALLGRPHLEEVLEGLRFRVGLDTFFQTNTPQAEAMVRYAVERVEPAGRVVFDLYCGVGTFSLPLARAGGRVAGVDLATASIGAASANAAANGIAGATFVAGDVRVMLPRLVATHGAPNVIVLDPPRAGAGGKVMRGVGRARPARVVYVSCNPTTLAPDLKELLPFGYRLIDVQPFDLFPHTHHVEAVAVLEHTSGGGM